MPEGSSAPTPFEIAAAAVQQWLDGAGAVFADRTRQPDPRRKAASWDVQLPHPVIGMQRARVWLPRDFPASPAQVHFDKNLCLVLPHIEESGRFCHGVDASPADYQRPAEAVADVLRALDAFWARILNPIWVQEEFQRERLSYWLRFCEQFRTTHAVAAPALVRATLQPLDGVTEGKVTAYFQNSQRKRSELMVATVEGNDPHVLAARHGWPVGSLVRGYALFVPMPENVRWTPSDWPRSLTELELFIAQVTDHTCSVVHWVESKKDDEPHPFLVVLVQTNVCYGYLVGPAPVPRLTLPGIIPVHIDRVDPDWALARDHQLPALHARREKRVLLLGCGSLGAPVADLIGRAGIGELHLLDKEIFEPENCSRHVLGASELGLGKAESMAKRLRQAIPGIVVKHHRAMATDWMANVCKPGQYDLVVDCTGDSTVRVMLTYLRKRSLGSCPVVHAWMEPFCAAAHVIYLPADFPWPADDPGDKVAAGAWPASTRVTLPACGAGFHPYGAADVMQAAGFTAERLLHVLDGGPSEATVWSWVRSQGFFDSLGVSVQAGPLVPKNQAHFDSVQLTRFLKDVLGDG